ncbi:MAG TPA: histidine kinase dimerization/phospho-acceptor domain-containing protein [Allosphingosinicella sp.]|nr:histidine kinase dimerization/phospho-acceptor domain-containing protein [Allosphingosinicella sp.]
MRFDDMIATVLAQAADRPDRRAARWRQLVDLLAQHRPETGSGAAGPAYALLRGTRAAIDPEIRRESARSLAGRTLNPDLVAFFAEDAPFVAAPLIAGARLAPEDWVAILPRLGPAARSLLRHREDLDPEVTNALAAFGPSDFVIEGGVAVPGEEAPAQSESQIRELVRRIEAYRKHKDSEAFAATHQGQAAGFRWETGTDGILAWVEGAPRGALVGQSIAWFGGPGQYGVDGQAAGGFDKRAPFRDARFIVAGDGPASGDWRISGIPFFDAGTGGFLGYRGTARRPRPDELARSAAQDAPPGVFGTQFPADSLRQLIHELRTPLNAILGFAEMIEGQYMGPAAAAYRDRAATIMEQARGLLGAVDDLDTAARIESRRLDLEEGAADAVALLVRLHDSYEKVAAGRGARIAIEISEGLPRARVEPGAAERMFARLLAGTIGLAGAGETIAVRLAMAPAGAPRALHLALDRPKAIEGLDETALLDPGYSPDGDWPGAPALGLGFALRLVRNLAEAVGGGLEMGADRFLLTLPAEETAAPPASRSEGSA